jgi:hypothetical protein
MWTLGIYGVALVHAAYLVFQTFGALLVLRHRRWWSVHPLAVTWGVGIVVVQGRCPLTMLEKHLVERSGGTPYEGSYLDHYLFGPVLPEGTQVAVYAAHLLVIIGTYVYVLRRTATPPWAGPGARADSPTGVRP